MGSLLVLLLCTAWPLPAQTVVQTNLAVRVMAANLTSGSSQSYEAAGIDILQGLRPDVVAIQEFRYGGSSADSQLRQLVDIAFGTNFFYFCEPYTASGDIPNGIVSRWPIVSRGSWDDPKISNRGFAWAQVGLPGGNSLYVVSVHLYSGGTANDRNLEATVIKTNVQTFFPPGAWVVVAGDFNTDTRTESALGTFQTFLTDSPIPTDQAGDADTNEPRSKPYDYVRPSWSMATNRVAVRIGSQSFPAGLVFDSRLYSPLADVSPVQISDSGSAGMQHMGVVKDFLIPYTVTNAPSEGPAIITQPQSQAAAPGGSVTFTVAAVGVAPLTYQWRFNDAPIAGAATTSYSLQDLQVTNTGAYSVLVSNQAGWVLSSNALLLVGIAPAFTAHPQSQTVEPGADVYFTAQASGIPAPAFQWLREGNPIAGATGTSLLITNPQFADAGNYSVTISNYLGSTTSSNATLTVNLPPVQATIIAQWDFNASSLASSTGVGTAGYVGGTTAPGTGEFASGSGSSDPLSTGNRAWNTTAYPAITSANKSAGVRFGASTAGWNSIRVRWDQQSSSTGTKYVRLQYTTNGAAFYDFPTAAVSFTTFSSVTNDLRGIAGVDNNPSFGFCIVAEFEKTATGNGTNAYVAANAPGSTYATTGTIRFDMVTVLGIRIPAPVTIAAPTLSAGQFQFGFSGITGSRYAVQASSNLVEWVGVTTNVYPFEFSEALAAGPTARFYRVLSLP